MVVVGLRPSTGLLLQDVQSAAVGSLPLMCTHLRTVRACLLNPWADDQPLTAAQLLACLEAAQTCIKRLHRLLVAAHAGATRQLSGPSGRQAIASLLGLLAQLRGSLLKQQQAGLCQSQLLESRAGEVVGAAQCAMALATALAQRWHSASLLLGPSSQALLQELLFFSAGLLALAAGTPACTPGGSRRAGMLAGVGVAAGAARLVGAVAQLPAAQLDAVSTSLDCDLNAELVSLLVIAAEASCSSAGIQAEREGSIQALLCEQLDSALAACTTAATSLVDSNLDQARPRTAARWVCSLAGMLGLLRRQRAGFDAAAGLERRLLAAGGLEKSLAAAALRALALQPVEPAEFGLAGSALEALRDAVACSPRLGTTLAGNGYLRGLVDWSCQLVKSVRRATARQMLFALRPAKRLVGELAEAVLRKGELDSNSEQYGGWAAWEAESDKKLRGRWLWETAAPQLLAWAAPAPAAPAE